MSFKTDLISIDPSKACLRFLADRILDNRYRGMQISQHNRYNVDIVVTVLEEMYHLVGSNLMTIRNEDLSSRPYNTPNEITYAKYTSNIKRILGRGTQDSIRKNWFVDLHRMGLIKRYDKNGNMTNPYEKTGIRFVSLTKAAIELIDNKNNTFQKNYIYTKAVDKLSHGLANDLLDILISNSTNSISIHEFMFFISYIGTTLNGHYYSRAELTDYMLEYRAMARAQKNAVVDIVSNYCNPDNFSGNKTNKRDYDNWKNEAQQIFMLMDQTVLFEKGTGKYSDSLFIRVGSNAIFNNPSKLLRSKKAKDDYFINHHISKKVGFELHHIIPLLIAKNIVEFDAPDVWQNMIYIDGYTHGIITQTNNKNIKIEFVGDDIFLKDISHRLRDIRCKNIINIEYSISNKSIMLQYNTNTISSL